MSAPAVLVVGGAGNTMTVRNWRLSMTGSEDSTTYDLADAASQPTYAERAVAVMPQLLAELSDLRRIADYKRGHLHIASVGMQQVIVVKCVAGNGVDDPVRNVTRYYTQGGVLIGVVDPLDEARTREVMP